MKSYILTNNTFLGVQVNLHSGVATGVKYLTSMDLQDGHGSGSANETTRKRHQHCVVTQAEQTDRYTTLLLTDLRLRVKTVSQQKT